MATHGKSKTKLYEKWVSMRNRCSNPKAGGYKNYGGRGIRVCDEWQKFEPFLAWSDDTGYRDDLSIDRIDVNGNYEPSNCRWVTMRDQCKNKRTTRLIEYNGKTQTLSDWSRELGLSVQVINYRIKKWKDIDRALSEGIHESKSHRKVKAS